MINEQIFISGRLMNRPAAAGWSPLRAIHQGSLNSLDLVNFKCRPVRGGVQYNLACNLTTAPCPEVPVRMPQQCTQKLEFAHVWNLHCGIAAVPNWSIAAQNRAQFRGIDTAPAHLGLAFRYCLLFGHPADLCHHAQCSQPPGHMP